MQVDEYITNMRKSHIYVVTCSFINILKSHIFDFIWGYSVSVSSCASKELNNS